MENINEISWEIKEKPIYANNQAIAGYKGLFRSDNGKLLSVAKKSYSPTTNEKFIEVAEKLHEITGFPIKNYYELAEGRKTLAFLQCTEPLKICGYEFKDFLMLGNSFDGSTGFFIGNSSMMVRCENRFTKNFRQLQVNHTKNNHLHIDRITDYFGLFLAERKRLFEKIERFADVKIDAKIRQALIERLTIGRRTAMNEEEKLGTSEISTRKNNIIIHLNESIDRECLDLGNNAFGLFNGVTHYTTHVKQSKNKVLGNPFGHLNELNQTAFRFCNELVLA